MSLRVRLNIFITLLFVLILVTGSVYAVHSARQAVDQEMHSVARLTSSLIEVILSTIHGAGEMSLYGRLLVKIEEMNQTRHLQVIIHDRGGAAIAPQAVVPIHANAPAWFVRFIKPEPLEFRKIITNVNVPGIEIIVRADPSDEITEAWHETRDFLLLLFLFTGASNVLIYFILGRDLAPIEAILSGLERIEQGDYKLRLPEFSTPEFSRISARFNHMAEVLLNSKEENRRLTRHSLEIQEKERRQLAQELHDEMGQSISAIKAVAISIEQSNGPSATLESTQIIKNISDDMYGATRRLIRQLRPTVLDELGLVLAVQHLVDDWNSLNADVFCHLLVKDCPTLDNNAKINIYRMIQESLTNVSRHAKARSVHVTLETIGAEYVLQIHDDGVGFNPQKIKKGMGLSGIQERVDTMQGKWRIETGEDKGLGVTITLPLRAIEIQDGDK